MHPYNKHTKFHFNHNVCWLTGIQDTYHSGIIDSCHLVDKSLLGDNSPDTYDQNNQIKLTCFLHRLFDARLVWFDVSGRLHSDLTPSERQMYGIPEGASLVPECLTPERKQFLEKRINDPSQFKFAVAMKKKVIHKASSKIKEEFYSLATKRGWLR